EKRPPYCRLCPRPPEPRQHLVADPLWWRNATRPQMVGAADDDVVAGFAGRRLALGRRHVADAEGFGKVPNPVEEARGMRRAIELQPGEVVVVYPFMQQRLEKDLGRQHLLADRGQVVDPDGAAARRFCPGDPVVAIGLQLQPPAARPVSLR